MQWKRFSEARSSNDVAYSTAVKDPEQSSPIAWVAVSVDISSPLKDRAPAVWEHTLAYMQRWPHLGP